MNALNVLIGAGFAGLIALVAYRFHALTRGGAVAAFVIGTITYASGPYGFAIVLLAFFLPSVALSRLGRARKRALAEDVGKAGARDAMQVLANGGVATLFAIAWSFTLDVRWAFAFAGAYAVATADTWATEIGTLTRRPPRSILTLRPVPAGLSGGVTLLGTLAEIAGAVWIGIAGLAGIALLYAFGALDAYLGATARPDSGDAGLIRALVAIPLAGIAGATLDSVLGATVQQLRRCDACDRLCETDPHACGERTRLVRGLRGFSNDLVNVLATAAGAGIALAIISL